MIESCPKRRMVFSISLLIIITLLVLWLESHWTNSDSDNVHLRNSFHIENNSTCWQREHYIIIKECEPCTDFEIASESIGVCIHTHFKEVLKCEKSGETVTRSCDRVVWLEQRNFWRFEFFMGVGGLIATIYCQQRRKFLNKLLVHRIQNQLANCV